MEIKKRIISLKYLIAYLAMAVMVATIINAVLAGYLTSKEYLVGNGLEMNRVYAVKQAGIVDLFLRDNQTLLKNVAKEVPASLNSSTRLREELNELQGSGSFESVMITDAGGRILAALPEGSVQNIPESLRKKALEREGASISAPFQNPNKQPMVFLAQTWINAKGQPGGIIGGPISLNGGKGLANRIGGHFYQDGSAVYIADQQGRILYHQDPGRLNETAPLNPASLKEWNRENGTEILTDGDGYTVLAGFASIDATGWVLVSQQPASGVASSAFPMAKDIFKKTLPLFALTLLLAYWLARDIARPLHQLSNYVENASHEAPHDLRTVSTWYYESQELKKAVAKSLNSIHVKMTNLVKEATTDPLSGLVNRRTLKEYLTSFEQQKTPFSLIMLDVDHFKRVNDTYGHQVGDEVIQYIAEKIRQNSRQGDICCRFGGEEFVILIPGLGVGRASQAAERLRIAVAAEDSPTGEKVTISLGVAAYPQDVKEAAMVLEKADQALYKAKQNGRNRTEISGVSRDLEPPAFLDW